MTDPSENLIKAMDLIPEKRTHWATNPVVESCALATKEQIRNDGFGTVGLDLHSSCAPASVLPIEIVLAGGKSWPICATRARRCTAWERCQAWKVAGFTAASGQEKTGSVWSLGQGGGECGAVGKKYKVM